jgi:hypothetical protein
LYPLMGSCLVEVRHIRIEDALKLPLVEDQQVVKAFLPHASQKAFTGCIGSRSVIGGSEHFNSTRCRDSRETGPKLVIVITEQILGGLPIGSGFPKLLRHPSIGRGSGNADMNHSPCLEFDDEEGKAGAKEEILHLQEVILPRICRGVEALSILLAKEEKDHGEGSKDLYHRV